MITRTFYIFYPAARRFLADYGAELANGCYRLDGQRALPAHLRVVLILMLADETTAIFSAKPLKDAEGEGLHLVITGTPDDASWESFAARAQKLAAGEDQQAESEPPLVSSTRPLVRAAESHRIGTDAHLPDQPAARGAAVAVSRSQVVPSAKATSGAPPRRVLATDTEEESEDDDFSGEVPSGSMTRPRVRSTGDTPDEFRFGRSQSRSEEGLPADQLNEPTDPELPRAAALENDPEAAGAEALGDDQSDAGDGSGDHTIDDLIDDAAADGAAAGELEQSLMYRLGEMSVADKRKLARRGGRPARNLLVRDQNKSVHLFVLQNPQITLDEVRAIARMNTVNPEIFKRIADDPQYNKYPDMLFDLVKNPTVPMKLAERLVPKLTVNHLRYLARAGKARSPIAAAARKQLFALEKKS